MSTLVSQIVFDALREGNLVGVSATPTTAQQNEAATAFNRLLESVFGYEMGEPLVDWLVPSPQRTAPVQADYPQLPYPQNDDFFALSVPFATDSSQSNIYPYPPKNSRIVFGGVTGTVYFPQAPDDGSRMAVVQGSGAGDSGQVGAVLTLNGNGRTIETNATTTFTFASPSAAPRQWFYNAQTGDWVALVLPLALTDQCPFPTALDDFWVLALNIRLAPRYGKAVSAETSAAFKQALARFKTRYRQTQNTVYGSNNIPSSYQSYSRGIWGTT